ncbi:MAG: carboxypeptidase regulatory-like domain-containing protein [Gemmatimonadales bacterium]
MRRASGAITLWHRGLLLLLLAFAGLAPAASAGTPLSHLRTGDLVGTVTDSASRQPIGGADITVSRNGQIVSRTLTDPFGRFTLHDLPAGDLDVEAHAIGYRPAARNVRVSGSADLRADFALTAAPVEVQALNVTATLPVAVDTRTGEQVYQQDNFHGSPTTTTSQILQQSIAGAARAPTGEVHIRGQHAEYTYYVDGVPVPSGISGSLNELFDPAVVNQMNFITGGWDAEYGGKNAAIVNVTTRVPAGGFHFGASSYAGSFGANGQGLSASGNSGHWGFFGAAQLQATDMRREPVLYDTTGNRGGVNFHNHGNDYFTFGKIQYTPDASNLFDLDVNWSETKFQVPFDSTGGVLSDDHQRDVNSFLNFGWRHLGAIPADGDRSPNEIFVGAFYRHGSLAYTPGAGDTPQFVFFPDTTPYNLNEDRNFNTVGVKADYTIRPHHDMEFKTGIMASSTSGQENFVTTDTAGNHGPGSSSGLTGSDVGLYAQTVLSPSEKFELRAGLRYDAHTAPFAGTQTQLSPRVRLNFFPSPATTVYLYYGRQFIPTNVEDLRAITSVADSGVATSPTLPERDDFYEIGLVHRMPHGIVTKLAGYVKRSSPGIDDNTIPGSAIVTSVNLNTVRVTGIEGILEVRPGGPFSGYLNVALNHGYGTSPVTGGFFPSKFSVPVFDEDHDQRLSVVGNLNYAAGGLTLSTTGIYGSGLTNGNDPDASYGTGLFDFNRSIKVDPSFILNASAGYSFSVGDLIVRPELFVDNVLNRKYLLKGAFFSGPAVGRPRTIQVRLDVGL